jgi:hypothetical protein
MKREIGRKLSRLILIAALVIAAIYSTPRTASADCQSDENSCLEACTSPGPPAPGCIRSCEQQFRDCSQTCYYDPQSGDVVCIN